jgi:hypothetical protein
MGYNENNVKFDVLTVVNMKRMTLWDVTPCHLGEVYKSPPSSVLENQSSRVACLDYSLNLEWAMLTYPRKMK